MCVNLKHNDSGNLQNIDVCFYTILLLVSFIQTLSLHKKKGTYYIQHISYSNESTHTFKQITHLMVVKSAGSQPPFTVH